MVCSSLDCSPEKLQRTVASVDEALVDLRHVKMPNLVRAMRKEELK